MNNCFSKIPSRLCFNSLGTHHIIILCVVIGILTVIPTVYCGCKKLRKNNIQLPKSLVSSVTTVSLCQSLGFDWLRVFLGFFTMVS